MKNKRDVVEAFELILRGARKLMRLDQQNRRAHERKRRTNDKDDMPKGGTA